MTSKLKGLALSVLAALAAGAAAQETKRPDVGARLEAIRARAGVPALGCALVTLEGLQGVWVAGTRCAGGTERVEPDDLWHLGSCTKSMTATLIALLVERGDLAWDALLPDLLPEIAERMDLDYLDVTPVELLCHRAGLPSAPASEPLSAIVESDLPLVEQRARFALLSLGSPPVHPPRGALLYSNGGFVIAGHLVEATTGKSWEDSIRELLFRPLGMERVGFGPPGSAGSCDQPRGHTPGGEPVEPGPDADNPPLIGPAGTVHASLADWARFVQLHLKGQREDVRVGKITLTRETFTKLHSPYDGPGAKYGFGWGIEQRAWAGGDGTILTHNGSNTLWYCSTWLGLENGVAVLATTNQMTAKSKAAMDEVLALVIEEFQRRGQESTPR